LTLAKRKTKKRLKRPSSVPKPILGAAWEKVEEKYFSNFPLPIPNPFQTMHERLVKQTRDLAHLNRELEDAKNGSRRGQDTMVLHIGEFLDEFQNLLALHRSRQNEGKSVGYQDLYQGLHDKFVLELEMLGIRQILPTERTFDPRLHMVAETVDDPALEPGTIVKTAKPGYSVDGRRIRKPEVVIVRQKNKP
jgi:molecular chaperone GrpE (heat shock protein)